MKTMRFLLLVGLLIFGHIAIAQKPTVSIGPPVPSLANSSTQVEFIVTYTDATSVTLGESNVTINHTGTSDGSIQVDGEGTETRTVTISGVNGDGTYNIEIASGTSSNAEGDDDAGPYTSDDVTVDNTPPNPPNVTGDTPTNNPKPTWTWSAEGGGNGTFRYKFNDSNLEDGATTTTETTYTHGIDLSDGSYTLYVQERDDAGNWSASGSHEIVVDLENPTVTITSDDGAFTNNSPFPITIAFSEEVTDFVVGDITVTNGNGTADNLNPSVDFSFTTDITPDSEGDVTIQIAAAVCTDLAGNSNQISNELTVTYYVATPPILTSVDIVSDNAYDTKLAKVGDEVKLTFSSERDLQNVNVNIATHVVVPTSSDDKSWEAVYTMESGDTEGTIPFSINFEDKAGNVGDEVTHLNFGGTNVVFDRTPPSAPNVTGDTPTNNPKPTWTWSSGGGDGVGQYRYGFTDGSGWEAEDVAHLEFTPSSDLTHGSYILYVQERDAAGNWSASGSHTIEVDTEDPTVTITSDDGDFTNNSPFQITIEFSEAVTGFLVEDITVTNGNADNLNPSVGFSFTADITPDSEGDVTIQIAAAVCTDLAGNSNEISNELTVTYYEDTPPTLSSVSITSNNANTNWAKVDDLVTITFSSARKLQNVTATIAGKTATVENTSANMKEWKAEYTMASDDIEGEISFLISFEDANGVAGSANATTDLSSVTFDRTPPSAPNVTGETITNEVRPTWNWTTEGGGNGTFRYKFNDSNLEDGTTTNTETTYTHGSDLSDDSYTFYVQERDDAGNWSASGFKTTTVDTYTEPPTLTLPASNSSSSRYISVDFHLPEAALPQSVKMIFHCTEVPSGYTSIADRIITFSELHETQGDHGFNLDGAQLDNSNPIYSDHIFDVFTEGSSGNKLIDKATYSVTLQYQDVVGNPIEEVVNESFFYSSVPPTAEFIDIDPNPRNTDVGTIQLVFSPRVRNSEVDVSDFTLTRELNGDVYPVDISGIPSITFSDYSSPSNYSRNYFLNLSAVTQDEGQYTLTLVAAGSGIHDYSGNLLIDDATVTWVCDKTPPTLTLNPSVSSPTNASSFTVTANISEPTETFLEGIIEVENAELSNFIVNSSSSYTFTIAPDKEGLVIIRVPADSFDDLATNRNATDTQISIVYDGTPPKPVITSTTSSPTNQTVIPIVIDFDETVTGFVQGDISISTGDIITDFATTNNKVFTFNLNVSVAGTYTVNIAENVCEDMAGNNNEAADEFSIEYDNSKPELISTTIESDYLDNKEWVRPGKKVFLEFESNEPIKDVVVQIHANSVQAVNTSGNQWGATYTFTEDDEPEDKVTFSIDFEDVAGNKVDEIVTNTNFGGTNVTFDKTKPTFTFIGISTTDIPSYSPFVRSGSEVVLEFSTSEETVEPQVEVNGTIVTDISGDLTTRTATITLGADEPQGNVQFEIVVKDHAGNISLPRITTTNDSYLIYDNIPPVINSISVPEGVYKVDDKFLVTINADDDIYSAKSIEINGIPLVPADLVNKNDNTYTLEYTVGEGDNEHFDADLIPVSIVLNDFAGNFNDPPAQEATVTPSGNKITIDTGIPQIASVSSDAETVGNLLEGNSIIFTVVPNHFETGLTVDPQVYNDEDLVWTADPVEEHYTAIYLIENGHPDQPIAPALGDVTLTDAAGNISDPVYYDGILKSIYANIPTATILGTTTECFDPELKIPITFEFTGYKPFKLEYQVDADPPITIEDLDAFEHIIELEGLTEGTHTISLVKLTDVNGNFTETADDVIITIDPLPTINNFDITSSPFNKDEDEVKLNIPEFVDPLGGVFSGNAVGLVSENWYFYPRAINAVDYDIDIPITYTYTDPGTSCSNSEIAYVKVSSGAASIEGFNPTYTYCDYADAFTVTGTNQEDLIGIFSIPSATSGWEQIAGTNDLVITPSQMPTGSHTVFYRNDPEGSLFEASRTFTIESVSVEDFITLAPAYCRDAEEVTLNALNVSPSGGSGTFSFNGPSAGFFTASGSNTAKFYPQNITAGDYQISYYYTSPAGCVTNTISKPVTVNPLPEVTITLEDNYNYDGGDAVLVGEPLGGTFSSGTVIHNNGILKPSLFTPGDLLIKYSYTDSEGCSASDEKQTRILKANEEISGLSEKYCYSNDTLEISCDPIIDPALVGQFFSNQGAIIPSDEPNKALYAIAAVGNGVDTVFFRYSIEGTPYEVFTRVLVDSIGGIIFSGLNDGYCEDGTQVEFNARTNHSPGTGTFTYTGNADAFTDLLGGYAIYRPNSEDVGTFSIKYTYSSGISTCKSDSTVQVSIYGLPNVSFTLPAYYNIDDPPFDLIGEPLGGVFSGNGVFSNKFYPEDAGPGASEISYSYSDTNGCDNSTSNTITVIGPDAQIIGIPAGGVICFDDEPIIITGTSSNGLPGYFEGEGITNIEPDMASFNPVVAGDGPHDITYYYLSNADEQTLLYISETIEVDNPGEVQIIGFNDELTYCHNHTPPINLNGVPADGTFSGNGIIANRFNPNEADVGINVVTYSYTKPSTGCSISGSVEVYINPIPQVHFSIIQSCSDLVDDPVQFINNTYSEDEVVDWLWTFGQGEGTSNEFEPEYLYTSAGSKLVSLQATTFNGCTSKGDSIITVGIIPEANFSWINECLTGEETVFTSTSDAATIIHYRWVLDDVELVAGENVQNYSYTFPEIGSYNMKLVITSQDLCKDSITKQVNIQPVMNFADLPNRIYYQDFEGEEMHWSSRGLTDLDYYSWNFGTPSGDIINKAASGSFAWFTNIDFNDQQVENSQVLSPCFDFTLMEKPMVKMNIWSSPEAGRNGAVLQYTTDNGLTWNNIGDLNTGINWYNSASIQSQPGGQFIGWSGQTMDSWSSARHSLDDVKGESNVRFRIAFAADGNAINYFEGFAFDDVWIGERDQKLLIEYFTNTIPTELVLPNENMVTIADNNINDILAINYHTSNPAGDQFYSYYPAGPSAREVFYGVSQIPYALVNGALPFSFDQFSQNQHMLDMQMLVDPLMHMAVEASIAGGLNVQVEIKALEEIAEQDLVLHCALVQHEVELDEPINGVSSFFSVLRDFLPNPGGTQLKTTWEKDEAETYTLSKSLPGNFDRDELKVIAFVQNVKTREVYQSESFNLSNITSDMPIPSSFGINIFPNPVNQTLWIHSQLNINVITIYDITGRIVKTQRVGAAETSINVGNFKNGLYLIKVDTQQGDVVSKFVKQ